MFDWEEKFLQNPKFSRNIGEKAELLAYTKWNLKFPVLVTSVSVV